MGEDSQVLCVGIVLAVWQMGLVQEAHSTDPIVTLFVII